MDGYVDTGRHGVTELRVHGVSGTSPEVMLGNPHVTRVAGDNSAGFYRRVWLEGVPIGAGMHADIGGRRREAYSWRGLTSGSARQALWLLLLPFALANVAYWMWPGGADSSPGKKARLDGLLRDVSTGLQRLFALSLTATFVLTTIVVAEDLLAWQCASPQLTAECLRPHGYLHFLSSTSLSTPGRRLAVMSILPISMVVLLWALGRATWHAHERHVPKATASTPSKVALAQPSLWNGSGNVRRLRSVHVSVGLVLCGIFVLAPLRAGLTAPARSQDLLLLGMLLFAAFCSGLLLLPNLWRPEDPQNEKVTLGRTDDVKDGWRILPWVGLLLLLMGLYSAVVSDVRPDGRNASLPYLSDSLVAVFFLQAAVFLLLSALTSCSAYATRRLHPARPVDGGALHGRALCGLGLPMVLLLSWVVAGALSAGVVIRSADYLGTPVPIGTSSSAEAPMLLSPGYGWAAATTVCLVLALAAVGGSVGYLCWRHARRVEAGEVKHAYAHAARMAQQGSPPLTESEVNRRLKQISRTWAIAHLTEHAPLLFGMLAGLLALSLASGSVVYWFGDSWVGNHSSHGLALYEYAPWLVTAGSWAIGVLALALLALTRAAYRTPGVRRVVGIIWDLGTFWPRATHPLAPPCYMERALPDLCRRIKWLTENTDDLVVLSTHSQGTVMAAAVVLQSEPAQRERLSLLTYGSPLQRLYQRFFPAYFGPDALSEVYATLRRESEGLVCQSRWRNLYRLSDPVGGPVLGARETRAEWYDATVDSQRRKDFVREADVDLNLLDPLFPRPEGDPAFPSALRHSDYFSDPYFEAAVEVVIDLARPSPSRSTS